MARRISNAKKPAADGHVHSNMRRKGSSESAKMPGSATHKSMDHVNAPAVRKKMQHTKPSPD